MRWTASKEVSSGPDVHRGQCGFLSPSFPILQVEKTNACAVVDKFGEIFKVRSRRASDVSHILMGIP